MKRRGFTLVELLTVISIIGILATIGTVNYSSSRVKGRDGKRLADMDATRQALEIYATSNGGYPADGVKGDSGVVLGSAQATQLSDGGWQTESGLTYLLRAPKNPGPFGAEYVYASLNNDGSACDVPQCPNYRLEFFLESDLVGKKAGAYIQSPEGFQPAPAEVAAAVLARSSLAPESVFLQRTGGLAQTFDAARAITIDNPQVQEVSEVVVAPVSTAVVVANAATALSVGQLGQYLYLLFIQPFLLVRKKKDYAWGIVYNSQTKLPVDLAIVRLVEEKTNRAAQTRVTDLSGRFFFFATAGAYRLEVAKTEYAFPAKSLLGATEDGKFGNLYVGGRIVVGEQGAALNPSIPLDPAGIEAPDAQIIKRFFKKQVQRVVALSGFFISLATFAVVRKPWVGALVVVHIIMYVLFRRLAAPKQPAQWGVVKDEQTNHPVGRAVVRLFTLPYNKLVDTRVSDHKGRYNFLVGQNQYFLTASHPAYWKTESYPLDLRTVDHPQVISATIALRPAGSAPVAPASTVDAATKK